MKKNEFIKAVIPLPSGGFDIFALIFCFTSNIVFYPLVVDVSGDIVFYGQTVSFYFYAEILCFTHR